ncbi:hypothetical protein SAMN05421862_11640 [Pseudomonas extremaustralis]|uniref:Gfo/Idh/MocA family protein n=1 Tax=Pseudomonas extremaustralis TaxID=359110 RepID=UPI00099C0482|nr:Gfo/Idh/MocA family oxidoreductase [Pseudomonas extremaustralis]SKB00851.1 hypothetical protein SAMN05421862_11640 [Pseudomonas extremaustralis]
MSEQVNYLVIGSGSIAKRHLANLRRLFGGSHTTIGCVSASGRTISASEVGEGIVIYNTLAQALENEYAFAIIASPAPWHIENAAQLLRKNIPLLIEKPLSDSLKNFRLYERTLLAHQDKIEVAYNLRFLPSAVKFKALLEDQVVGAVQGVSVDVGQYLPDWRPASDYRKNVSARKELGGGVLLELSHDLDYLGWLFGKFETAYCVSRNTGTLDVNVEDVADALLVREDRLTVAVHMDFLQRSPVRTCKVIGALGTLVWDIISNTITLRTGANEKRVLFEDSEYDRNNMYLDQLRHFSDVASGNVSPAISVNEGLNTLYLIEAMKASALIGLSVKIGESQA